jgi:tRNA nucleotidyltransferase (CCA-adding enzyme)
MKISNINFEDRNFFIRIFQDKVYLVGGTIRDFLLYKKSASNKDIDLLVTHHSYQEIVNKLAPHGRTNTVGKSFAVVKFTKNKITYDISIPRTDIKKSSNSSSHKNFIIESDPFTPVEEDLKRRDFTCNSIALNLFNQELIDPFNGVEAIDKRMIEMTNPNTFSDDPLRILRCARFAGVHSFKVKEDIYKKVKNISFKELSSERIVEELFLLLFNSETPSRGLTEYFNLTILKKVFPEIYQLTLTLQDSVFHPETDLHGHHSVWGHTLIALDIAAKLSRHLKLSPQRTLSLLLGTLLHDIGKPSTTEWEFKRGRMTVTSIKHDSIGSRIADRILTRFKIETRSGYPLKQTVINLVKNHHRLYDLYRNRRTISFKAITRTVRDLEGEDFLLLLLDQADRTSRDLQRKKTSGLDEISLWYQKKKEEWNISKDSIEPLIQGRDLLKLGVPAGKIMGENLKILYEYQLDGKFKTIEQGLQIFKTNLLKK